MKKLLSIVCVFALLLTLMVVPAQAAGTPTLTVSTTEVNQSATTADVTVTFTDNPGIAGMQFDITYDSALKLTNVVKGDALPTLTLTPGGDKTANPFRCVLDGQDADFVSGTVVTFTFTLPELKKASYPITLTTKKGDIYDNMLDDVIVTVVNGGITVPGAPTTAPTATVGPTTEPTEAPKTPIMGMTSMPYKDNGCDAENTTFSNGTLNMNKTKTGAYDVLVWGTNGMDNDTFTDTYTLSFDANVWDGSLNNPWDGYAVSLRNHDVETYELIRLYPVTDGTAVTFGAGAEAKDIVGTGTHHYDVVFNANKVTIYCDGYQVAENDSFGYTGAFHAFQIQSGHSDATEAKLEMSAFNLYAGDQHQEAQGTKAPTSGPTGTPTFDGKKPVKGSAVPGGVSIYKNSQCEEIDNGYHLYTYDVDPSNPDHKDSSLYLWTTGIANSLGKGNQVMLSFDIGNLDIPINPAKAQPPAVHFGYMNNIELHSNNSVLHVWPKSQTETDSVVLALIPNGEDVDYIVLVNDFQYEKGTLNCFASDLWNFNWSSYYCGTDASGFDVTNIQVNTIESWVDGPVPTATPKPTPTPRPTTIPDDALMVTPKSASLTVGSSKQLEARLELAATDVTLDAVWSSDNSAVASVNARGVVSANKEGSTTIRVAYEGLTASMKVTVTGKSTDHRGGIGGGSGVLSNPTPMPVPTVTPAPQLKDDYFDDLAGYEWAQEAIDALAEANILQGVANRTFAPGKGLTRAEMLALLVRYFNVESTGAAVNFKDVSSGDWYYDVVAAGIDAGIITGYDDGSFRPNATVTRQEMATMIGRALEYLKITLPAEGEGSDFADAAQIAAYAFPYVEAMERAGIINGMGNNCFEPNTTANRAQAAVLVYRLINALK